MRHDPQDELPIEVSRDLVDLCRRLDADAAGARVRAFALTAEAYEAHVRSELRVAA